MRILTFDVEEWFHILDHDPTKAEGNWARYERRLEANLDRILELLAARDLKATFFCLGWVVREYGSAIERIHAAGHEIASHSDRHQLAYEQDRREFRADLDRSIKVLEDAIGVKIRAYRAPGFSLTDKNKWVFEELIGAGIEIDCSIFPARRAHGGFESFSEERPAWVTTPSGKIKEFPMNTAMFLGRRVIFSGGGYFRLFPLPLLRHFIRRADYVMTYFHPRDFDVDQPLVANLSFLRRFKSYFGLKGAQKKLEALLDEFRFMSLSEAEKSVEWDKAPVVRF